jgi:hypothetical protein
MNQDRAVKPRLGSRLSHVVAEVEASQRAVLLHPYSIKARLDLAQAYSSFNYHDLSTGEAYKALLLGTDLLDECGEYHVEAIKAAKTAIWESPIRGRSLESQEGTPSDCKPAVTKDAATSEIKEDDELRHWASTWMMTAYVRLPWDQ